MNRAVPIILAILISAAVFGGVGYWLGTQKAEQASSAVTTTPTATTTVKASGTATITETVSTSATPTVTASTTATASATIE